MSTEGMKAREANLYAEREVDSDELMPHYLRHVDRMTVEGLHAKSAIAAELAWRDAEIERLRALQSPAGGEAVAVNLSAIGNSQQLRVAGGVSDAVRDLKVLAAEMREEVRECEGMDTEDAIVLIAQWNNRIERAIAALAQPADLSAEPTHD